MNNRTAAPQVSAIMAKGVSEERRATLSNEVDQGLFSDGSSPSYNNMTKSWDKDHGDTPAGRVIASSHATPSMISKYAQGAPGGMFRGTHGDSVKQTPEVYSPLWLNSNLNLPRDRATINAWCRSFYALNPFVHNAINLHSTYPISKLNIKCPNKDIEKFFNDMIEEIDLMNICVQIAQEYWLLGEAFVYSELDESKGKWSRLLIQNPDFMIVKRTVVANEPIIMLRPDANLQKIIFSNKPSDIEQRKQLNQHIIDSVRRGENIPLDNFHVSHLARRISPYEIRGTGLPVCIFRQLMLFDKLRECYSTDTEVLTDQGFKTINELIHITSQLQPDPNYINGLAIDETGNIDGILTLKDGVKIACINPENNQLEYHVPNELHMSKYNGKMLHFNGKHVDTLVTPNHKMWAKKRKGNEYQDFELIKASDFSQNGIYKFTAKAEWNGGEKLDSVNVLEHQIPIDVYLKFIGHVISEGCVDANRDRIIISQLTQSPAYEGMRSNFEKFGQCIEKHVSCEVKTRGSGFSEHTPKEAWIGTISSKALHSYLFSEIGVDEKCDSFHKSVPNWILSLHKSHLMVLLNALVEGDGSKAILTDNNLTSYRYFTSSRKLASDVQEMAFKCGYSAFISEGKREEDAEVEYTVRWSDSDVGGEPIVCNSENQAGAKIKEVDYDGVVWCFEVPTGLFITRRNNRIAIQGNSKYAQADNMVNPLTVVKIGSADYKPTFADLEAWRNVFEEAQYDKDFKIFTHEGVDVTRVGYGSGIYDISGDITQLVKEIYVGLQVPPVLMDGGADTTYANGGVALDVLRQRYMQFRNMMSQWLKRKVFAPISKIQGFYDYSGGQKQLIVPEIDWNHMSLFDAGDYINSLVTLTQGTDDAKRVSLHTLYRSIGLEFDDEVRKMRKESIQLAINKKEKTGLEAMDLNALRALDDEDEIPEPDKKPGEQQEAPLPGETPGGAPSGGMPDLGAPPPPGGGPPPDMGPPPSGPSPGGDAGAAPPPSGGAPPAGP